MPSPFKPLNPQKAADASLAAELLRQNSVLQALTAAKLCAALARERLGQIAPGEGADIPRLEAAMLARARAGHDPFSALDMAAAKGHLDYPWTVGCDRARPALRAACAQFKEELELARKRAACAEEGRQIAPELAEPAARRVRPSAL